MLERPLSLSATAAERTEERILDLSRLVELER